MNTKKKLIVTMDIGSSKISCMQAITDNNDITTVIGLSVIASKGIKSGIITDFNLATESIAQALLDCEKQSNQSIEELSVSIASHKCSTKIMKSKVKTKDEKVSQYDVQYSIKKVLENEFFIDKKVINISPTDYIIDKADGISNPIEMYGSELEISFLVTFIGINQYRNYVNSITACNVNVRRIVFSNYAAGLAILNEHELDLGAVVLDIGARTTSLGIFSKNNFIFSDVLQFGGHNITETIARKLNITFEEAEKIKVMHASVLDSSKEEEIFLEIPSINFENEDSYIQVTRRNLYEIVKPFYEELLNWVYRSIASSGKADLIGRVLVFTGGASQVDGLSILANNMHNYNSRIGTAKNLMFNSHHTLDTSCSVLAGLVENELNIGKKIQMGSLKNKETIFKKKKNFSLLKNWLAENFF